MPKSTVKAQMLSSSTASNRREQRHRAAFVALPHWNSHRYTPVPVSCFGTGTNGTIGLVVKVSVT